MITVTGDSGFIGSYLTRALIGRGHSIHGLDIVPRKQSDLNYTQIVGNILDPEATRRALSGSDCVIHLAAEHKDFGVTRAKYFLVNRDGTRNLLDLCSSLGIKKFMFYSSVAVYGNKQSDSEDVSPSPNNPYGESKLAAEQYIREWVEQDPTRQAAIIRPVVVFGPFGRANIFKLIKYVCDEKFIWVGSGEQVKSVASVDNLVEATCFLLDRMRPGLEIYNYSDEPQMTTRQLVELIAEKAGVKTPRRSVPLFMALAGAKLFDGLGSITHRDFPVTSARIKKFNTPTRHDGGKIRSLGFKPSQSLEHRIGQCVDWYLRDYPSNRTAMYESSES